MERAQRRATQAGEQIQRALVDMPYERKDIVRRDVVELLTQSPDFAIERNRYRSTDSECLLFGVSVSVCVLFCEGKFGRKQKMKSDK
jgi:hypothetical protein